MPTAVLQVKKLHWEMIRERFTEEEREKLRSAVIGESILPRAMLIDEKNVTPALLTKLKKNLGIK